MGAQMVRGWGVQVMEIRDFGNAGGFQCVDDIICMCRTTGYLHVQCWKINKPSPVGKNLGVIEFLSNFQVYFNAM